MKYTDGYEIQEDIYNAIISIIEKYRYTAYDGDNGPERRDLYKGYKILTIQRDTNSYEVEIIFDDLFTNFSIPKYKVKSCIMDNKLNKILGNE